MKTRILYGIAAIVLVVGLTVSANAAMVSQGKCVSYDDAKKILVMEEYDTDFTPDHKWGKSTGKEGTYDCAPAFAAGMVGPAPRPGDIIRIAYQEKGGQKMAIRVMNVTRTDIMRK